jgi:hypothetical protein
MERKAVGGESREAVSEYEGEILSFMLSLQVLFG